MVSPGSSRVVAIVGATATGKSALADALAVALDGEVINADSMQVYRGMDIGTAKLPAPERGVRYHCVDVAEPSFPFTAALYQRHARAAIDDVLARGKTPVLCGGSGLYLRAALDDFRFDEAREIDEARETDEAREALTREAARLGPEAFHALLAERDPRSAALIHPHNVRRVIRAFEFLERQTSYAEQHEGFSSFVSIYPVRLIGLSVEPALLYEAIGRRVDAMLEAGLLDEVRGLLDRGLREASALRQAIGYKELAAALEGHCTLEEAVEQVKQATRRYAKRQRSWFRRDGRIEWIEVSDAHRQLLDGNIDETDFVRLLRKRALMLLQCSEELGPATDTI